MPAVRTLLGSLLVMALATACTTGGGESGAPPPAPEPSTPVAVPTDLAQGSRWRLVWTADSQQVPDVTLTFTPGELAGKGPVNRYTGQVQAGDDGSLQVTSLTSTEMGGTPEQMAAEQAYFAALAGADGWQARNEELNLLTGDEPVLRYALPGSPAVFGMKLVGLELARVEAAARKRGYPTRVINVDGTPRPMTMDYRPDRLNLYVRSGIVTQVMTG